MIYGYARVSTAAQDERGQVKQLKAAGCGRIFREKITGTTADRPQLGKLMKRLAPGGVVITPAVDRLSRDTTDLLVIARDMQRAPSRCPVGSRSVSRYHIQFRRKIVFAIFGAAAQLERRHTLERMARPGHPNANGVKSGPSQSLPAPAAAGSRAPRSWETARAELEGKSSLRFCNLAALNSHLMTTMPITLCRLCGEMKELRESHILPGFVYRWMKETSATGYLRFAQEPNRRVQDGLKVPLLCADCEQRFNQWETQFANRIFHPMTQGDTPRASYGAWLLLFCASVSWRVLVYFIDGKHIDHVPDALLPSVNSAEVKWREFLLGNCRRLQPHEQHILPFGGGALESYTHSEMPTNINRYLFRTPDMSVASNDRDAFTYSKLGPFIILGFIAMPRPKQWVGAKVNVQGGAIGPRDYVLPKPFDDFIFARANRAAVLQERISGTQTAKIAETYRSNLGRAAQSDSMRVMDHDVKLFGSRAFRRQ